MCRAEAVQVVGAERVDQRPVDVALGEQGLDHQSGQPGEAAGRQREARTAAAAPEQLPGGVGRGERGRCGASWPASQPLTIVGTPAW